MTWLKSFSDGKGGFNTFDWSIGDSLTYGIINLVIMFIIFAIFLAVLPIILLISYPFCGPKNKRIVCVVSVILSILFLIDYSIGYMYWGAFNVSQDMIESHISFATVHASLILINIILFLQAEKITIELDYNFNRAIVYLILVFLVIRVVIYPNLYNKVSEMRSKTKYYTESVEK